MDIHCQSLVKMYPLFNIQIFSKLIFYAFLENTRVVSAFFYQAKSRTNLVFKNNDFCVEIQLSLGGKPQNFRTNDTFKCNTSKHYGN